MFSRFFPTASSARQKICFHAVIAVACLLPPCAARAASGIAGYVILPLALMDRANQATVRVSLNGKSTMLVLDTGANVTVLDQRFYRGTRAGTVTVKRDDLPPEMQRKVTANGERAEIGYIDSLRAGSTDFGKSPVLVTDLSATINRYNAAHPTAAIAGLLGEDFLRKHFAIIDWARRGVYVNVDPSKRLKPGTELVAAGWTAVPMTSSNTHHFTVEATVSGKPVRLIVDTGAQFTSFAPGIVPLEMMYNRDNGGSIGHLASNALMMSMIGGDTRMYPARVEHWKIGSFEIASSVVAVQTFPVKLISQSSGSDAPLLGLLGSEVLARHNAIIDVGGSKLYLKAK